MTIAPDAITSEERERRAIGRAFAYVGYELVVVTLVAAWFVASTTDVSLWLYLGSFVLGLVVLVLISTGARSYRLGTLQFLVTVFAATEGVFFGAVAEGVGVEPLLSAFGIGAAIALGMSILGYLNPRDMAGLGPPLLIALLGLLALMIVSAFVNFDGLDLAYSAIGVVVFSLYTAYDVNQIRKRAIRLETDEAISRLAIEGSIDVYLDLANLVIDILRLRASLSD